MFGTLTSLTLALAIGAADPRPRLVELQLEGKTREALGLAEQELASRPASSRQMGLDYLRGHLLDLLGNPGEANEAFVEAMGATPALHFYSRYRVAMEQDRMSHPEVAAGLVVSLLEEGREDDPAQVAAERLVDLVSESESGRLPMLLGLTFHQHREFDRALRHLKRSLGEGNALAGRDDFEARYALGRSHFWQGRYAPAVE